jgi:predicted metal-binding protein
LAFEETGPVEIIGFLSCGGCSGKKAVTRAKMMVDRGAEAIVFASCIFRAESGSKDTGAIC